MQKRWPITSPSSWYQWGYQDFLRGQDNTGAHTASRGMHGDGKGRAEQGYGIEGGSSSGVERVGIWLPVLSWILHLDMRCDWNGPDSLERIDPVVMWFT